jgi:hypothetical protein
MALSKIPTNMYNPFALSLAASDMPTGAVLQVVQSTHGTQVVANSQAWTDTGFTGAITPTSATSKVLALCQIPLMSYINNSNECIGFGRLARDASNFSGSIVANGYDYGGNGQIINHTAALNWLDSPATTSAITYTFQLWHHQGTETRLIYQNADASMILMEIAG